MPKTEITPTWLKTKNAARYANVSERTFREWYKNGLRHLRLPSGTILVKTGWVDNYLSQFEVKQEDNVVDRIVDEVWEDFG